MLRSVSRIEHILIKLSCEIARKSVNLSLFLFDNEFVSAILLERLIFSLVDFTGKSGVIWVGQMAECEYILTCGATGPGSAVDFDNVG